jgi:RimJ/RimL family protein N-acetyltransferase
VRGAYGGEVTLEGRFIRLEPLDRGHAAPLAASSATQPSLYEWSAVPQGESEVRRYIDTALAWAEAGTCVPFATRRRSDGAIVGSTRFFDVERWPWPEGTVPADRRYDACEIGYTWLTRDALRTPINTEAKLLMLTHAFETWRVFRVCFHTDERNARSRAAIERIGGRFEGILRAHRLASDLQPRNSARYSIVAAEWPDVRRHLESLLAR